MSPGSVMCDILCVLGRIRTCYLLLRREPLYPNELQGLEPPRGFEPLTHALQKRCSTAELRRQILCGGLLCPGPDSNRHELPHNILSVACLPFHHPGSRHNIISFRDLYGVPNAYICSLNLSGVEFDNSVNSSCGIVYLWK